MNVDPCETNKCFKVIVLKARKEKENKYWREWHSYLEALLLVCCSCCVLLPLVGTPFRRSSSAVCTKSLMRTCHADVVQAGCQVGASVTVLLDDARCKIAHKSTYSGGTAILLAARGKHWDVVGKLFEYKASRLQLNPKGKRLISLAKEGNAPPHTLELIKMALTESLAAGRGGGESK